ncbi:MAG: phosphohydrolase [Bacteroidia bacterium]|nr:phosphohydrolase [Bacteroidia bacterium]
MKTHKEQQVEEKILKLADEMVAKYTKNDELPRQLVDMMLRNREIKAIQDHANSVSITRIGLNDHGPVHMKKVCYNAIKMLKILHDNGIETSLEKEGVGSFADSLSSVIIASLLHDSGMTIARKHHELYSGIISYSLIREILQDALPGEENTMRRTIIQSTAMEGILGHMGSNPIHSLEAGVILIADGCDMTKGRARIPLEIPTQPTEGDIHKYSAHSVEKVKICKGEERPIRIEIHMKSEVGFFQVEAVLIPKITASPAKHLIELYAGVLGEELKRYR